MMNNLENLEVIKLIEYIKQYKKDNDIVIDEKVKSLSRYELEKLPALPNGWEWCISSDISLFITNGVHTNTIPEDDNKIGFRMLRITDIDDNNFADFSNLPYCARFVQGDYDKTLKKNDIYISFTGNKLGKRYYVKSDVDDVVFAHYFVRWHPIIVNPKFIYYAVLSYHFDRFMFEHTLGSTQPNLKVTDLKRVPLPLPKIYIQNKIEVILSTIDTKIEINNKINERLEKTAKALYQEWFVNFNFPNEDDLPYKDNGGEFFETELGEIPESWSVQKIKDISKQVVTGKTPSTKVTENYGSDIPFITIPDMRDNVWVVTTERQLSIKGAESQKNKTLPKGCICVSCIATPGLVSLTAKDSQTNQQINSIVCKEYISRYYIYFSLKSKEQEIITLGSGGTATYNLNKGNFENMALIIPKTITMNAFNNLVEPIFEKILILQNENIRLNDLKNLLLNKLMSGEIDTDELDINWDKLSETLKEIE